MLHWGHGRSNPSDIEAYGRQGIWKAKRQATRIQIKENSKNIFPFAHNPMYMCLRVISAYISEKGIKSHVQQIMGVFRDDIGNIKGTKIVHGSKEFTEG